MPKAYKLPEELRQKLAEPLGTLFSSSEVQGRNFISSLKEAPLVVSVGDRVTETLGSLGRTPDVQVVDGLENRIMRKPPELEFVRQIEVSNPPGTVSEDAIRGVISAFEGKKPVRVLVSGEEDLVAVPVIAFAPPATVVLYGQPGRGIVRVVADRESKERSREIMRRMGVPEETLGAGAS